MAEDETPEMSPEQMEAFEKRMDGLMMKAKDTVSEFLNTTKDVSTFDVVQYAILFNIYIGRVISEQEYTPEHPLRVKEAMMSVFAQAFSALDILAETNAELGPDYVPERYKDIEVKSEAEEESE